MQVSFDYPGSKDAIVEFRNVVANATIEKLEAQTEQAFRDAANNEHISYTDPISAAESDSCDLVHEEVVSQPAQR